MTRVLVFTDEPAAAAGVKSILGKDRSFRLAGTSDSPATMIEAAEAAKADLVLVDMTPDVTFGILIELQKKMPDVRIVMWVRTISTELAYQAIENGIRGILRKTLSAEMLLKCLQMVADGGLWFEESLRAGFMAAKAITLSRRESQLVGLLSQGLKNKEIASLLLISEGTVKVYLSRLFHKLGVNDRFELALYGLKNAPAAEFAAPGRERKVVGMPNGKQGPVRSEWLRSLVMNKKPPRVRSAAN